MEAIALILGYGVLIVLAVAVLITLVLVGIELYCRYRDNRDRDQFLIKSELRKHAMAYTTFLDSSGYTNADQGYAAFIAHLNSHAG